MAKNTDVVQHLHDATRQRESLAGSLLELTQQAERTSANRRAVTEELDRQEGDALIGRVADTAVQPGPAGHIPVLTYSWPRSTYRDTAPAARSSSGP